MSETKTKFESCSDCVYSSYSDNMQACVWQSGLASAYMKCDRYKRSWQKAIMPYVALSVFLAILIRLFVVFIWGV